MTMTSQTDEWMEKAGLLIEALPYMRRYSNKPIVVKFGGHAMGEQAYVDSFAADMRTSPSGRPASPPPSPARPPTRP